MTFAAPDILLTCGVATISSLSSSCSINVSSSSELLPEASEVMAFVDATERGTEFLSLAPDADQLQEELTLGESKAIDIDELRLEGGIIGFWFKVGEESGDDCSANVEWCRLVAAREKSMPRE